MVDLICRTNLDLEPCESFPTRLPELPRIGDRISSKHFWNGNQHLYLKVCSVTWEYRKPEAWQAFTEGWVPVVELTAYQHNITAFYEFYCTLTGKRVSAYI